MHSSVQKLLHIKKLVKSKELNLDILKSPTIIAVSKTFSLDKIMPLIDHGHCDYGENKVQEALDKWSKIKLERPELVLHLIGKLQTNKVKLAVKLFDYIHSVDNEKLAKKISDPDPFFHELNELNKNLSLKDLSIGMSSDYIKAVENHSTYLRVGSAIFGNRT